MHPSDVLIDGRIEPPVLPAVDHYCGTAPRIAKALALQASRGAPVAFDVTADCEDGAPVGAETEHARMVGAAIASPDNRHGRVGVRVHAASSPHFRTDLDLVLRAAGARVAYVTLPKVESAAECARAIDEIDAAASVHARGRASPVPVHVLIESPGALREVDAIAAHPRVECLSFGLMDYVSAFLGTVPDDAMRSPGQFDHPLVRAAKVGIALAAHAHGKVASHNVSVVLDDPDAVRSDARRAANEFSYARMWSIHPAQIDPILAGIAPPAHALDESAEVLLAARDAAWAPVRVRGHLHDRASYRFHWHRLRRARAAGASLPEAARAAFFDTSPSA